MTGKCEGLNCCETQVATPTLPMNDDRLTELETRLTYTDHTVAELGDLLYAQSRTIDELAERCRRLEQRLATLAEPDDRQPAPKDEIPPHY